MYEHLCAFCTSKVFRLCNKRAEYTVLSSRLSVYTLLMLLLYLLPARL